MNTMTKLTLTTEADKHVVITFAGYFAADFRPKPSTAPASTEPWDAIIQKWLLGPDGWTMPVCINEVTALGGKFRWPEWVQRQRRRLLHHRRTTRARALQQNRPHRKDVPPRPNARQPRRNPLRVRRRRHTADHANNPPQQRNPRANVEVRNGARPGSQLRPLGRGSLEVDKCDRRCDDQRIL